MYLQYRAYSRPEAIDQTPYSLETGVEILTFFEEYFNISYPLPKQGNTVLFPELPICYRARA